MIDAGRADSFLDMKSFTFLALLLFLPATLAKGQQEGSGQLTEPILLSLTAAGGSYSQGELKLEGIPGVVWFSDRPERKAGHLTLPQLGDRWNKGKDSFSEDPPNATLAIAGVQEQAVLELMNPTIEGDSVKFAVKILTGEVPADFEASSLFIDFDGWGDSW